jgi:aminoglycoside phosphotransferase (APT) family kinase protein
MHTHLDRLCAWTGARSARPQARIQSLWSGYGEVRRIALQGAAVDTVVVKHVKPPVDAHPRKLRSYQVERCWYQDWAPRCDARVPAFFGAWSDGTESVFALEDLGAAQLAPRRMGLSPSDARSVLRWLARFHACFLGCDPVGLWPQGTYWHLATRQLELQRMPDGPLKRDAAALDAQLRGARFQTLVHGDAKPANFLLSRDGETVAAVDFQYVGGGPGIRDVAYLLEGFGWLRGDRGALLDHYFACLLRSLGPAHRPHAAALETEWRGLLPVAQRDFERFLAGWR